MQTVRADDPSDDEQVALVREHLTAETLRFQQGDFDDPASIHGADMPGLAALEHSADSLTVSYRDVPSGGEITYRSSVDTVVAALHDWFAAQVSDHGEHAMGT